MASSSRETLGRPAGLARLLGCWRLLDRARWRRLLTVERVLATAEDLPDHRGARRLAALLAVGLGEQESPVDRHDLLEPHALRARLEQARTQRLRHRGPR